MIRSLRNTRSYVRSLNCPARQSCFPGCAACLYEECLTDGHSDEPQRNESKVRHGGKWATMGWHDGFAIRMPVLVLQATHVLDTARLGALLRRVDYVFPPCAAWQHQHTSVVDSVCEHHRARSGGIGRCDRVGHGKDGGQSAEGAYDDGCGGRQCFEGEEEHRRWRGEEGALVYEHRSNGTAAYDMTYATNKIDLSLN